MCGQSSSSPYIHSQPLANFPSLEPEIEPRPRLARTMGKHRGCHTPALLHEGMQHLLHRVLGPGKYTMLFDLLVVVIGPTDWADRIQALIRAALSRSTHVSILPSIIGIIFLGTPHLGMRYAWFASSMARVLHVLHSNPLPHLQLHAHSPFLRRQHDRFITHTSQIKVINMFETRGTVLIPALYGFPPLRVHVSHSHES
jgi:hypothetical protein